MLLIIHIRGNPEALARTDGHIPSTDFFRARGPSQNHRWAGDLYRNVFTHEFL
jgi:hypothetical protein